MAEIAGLAVGVIPIVVEILKSYRTARARLHAFKEYTRVISDVQLRYRVAAANFSNECQLLLKTVVDDGRELSEMMAEPLHAAWQSLQLEARFRAFLEQDYPVFEEIILLIRDVLRETQTAIEDCNVQQSTLDAQRTAQRLYLAFDISRKENKYRHWLDALDQWNKKLSKLRKQRCKLHKSRSAQPACLVRKAVPRQYSDIRTASQKLHESLQDSWSCTNVSHTGHQAKLSLKASADYGKVRLDMVIACRRKAPITTMQVWIDSVVTICLTD
jgi:hypothetical protein